MHSKIGYVYLMASGRNGTLYVGVTSDLARRVYEHKSGATPGFTSMYRTSLLVWFEPFANITEAIATEKRMKKWRRAWKIELIESVNPDWDDLYRNL